MAYIMARLLSIAGINDGKGGKLLYIFTSSRLQDDAPGFVTRALRS